MDPSHILALTPRRRRAETIGALRSLLPRLEGGATEATLAFGIPELDSHLPQSGLSLGALHEIAPASGRDWPAAFGFMAALIGRLPAGPLVFVAASRGFAENGRPFGHGLNRLGLDPARAILVNAANAREALWALEEAARAKVPAAGFLDKLDLRASQRLQVAARETGVPLFLLRPADATETSAAATRWRIGAASAIRDRFGLIARWRWRVGLERCRNGRPGEWVVEFDHAYRFSLAAALADPAFPRRADAPSVRRTG